jgi:hypothetical protein
LRHSVKLRTLDQDTSLCERVEHPGLPGLLCHSVKLQTSTPGDISETSRPTWGIVPLCQTTDFYPRRHTGLPGVLRHSVKLQTSTPGDIAETSRPTWGIASLLSNYGLYPRINSGESVSRWAVGPCWHDDVAYTIVDLWQCVILEARLEVTTTNNSCPSAHLRLFKTCGKTTPPIGCLHARQLALIWRRHLRRRQQRSLRQRETAEYSAWRQPRVSLGCQSGTVVRSMFEINISACHFWGRGFDSLWQSRFPPGIRFPPTYITNHPILSIDLIMLQLTLSSQFNISILAHQSSIKESSRQITWQHW